MVNAFNDLQRLKLLSQFGATPDLALVARRQFVLAGIGNASPLRDTHHQMVLGDQAFVTQHADRLGTTDFAAVIKDQRRLAAMMLPEYEKRMLAAMSLWRARTIQQR